MLHRCWLSTALAGACLILAWTCPTVAYDPGSGTLYSDDFESGVDPDWEMGNGFGGQPSPWTIVADGGDNSFLADGVGMFAGAATRHWARHFVHPVDATTYSMAFEYRAELGTDYRFHVDVEQRSPVLRKYRLAIDAAGVMTLARSEDGALVEQVSSGSPVVTANSTSFIRFAIEEDGLGLRVAARVWSGSAQSEPATWTLSFVDPDRVVERVHRFELDADGPRNVDTFVDDLDVFGDAGAGVFSTVKTIYLMELSHLDIGFTLPPDDIELFAKTHLDDVLDNLDSDPDYRWTIESGWFLDKWWERSDAAERSRMLSHLGGERLRLAAGYANLHTTVVGHEQLSRSIYYSTEMARENDFSTRVFITDDVPGATFALPELLARGGIDYYVGGMNCSFGGQLDAPSMGERPIWWVGPDGSRILSWLTYDGYAEAFAWGFSFFDNLDDLYEKMGKKIPELEEFGYPWPELLLMRGFDNHYQNFHARDLAEQWNATYETPTFVLSTAEEFLDHMLATYGPDAFPSFSGDFGGAWANSRANAPHTHNWIRRAHRNARAAEALIASGAVVDGRPAADAEREELYRLMLTSDEHTGAGGWPGYFNREEMDRNNRIHLGYARDARDAADTLLAQGLDRSLDALSAAGDAVVVVNPLGRERDGWARTALSPSLYGSALRVVDRSTGIEEPYQRFDATEEILFRARGVPSMGYRVYDLLPGEPTAEPEGLLSATETTLENDFYRIEIDPASGAVTSLFDKQRGSEIVDGSSSYRFNELATNIHQDLVGQAPPNAQAPTSADPTLVSAGPLLAEIRVTRMGTPHRETTYRLFRGDDRFEFENVLDEDLMPYVPESIGSRLYTVTLPFDIHEFEIRSETTTRFLDPLSDGFARSGLFDWHNVEHTLAFFDDEAGVLHAADATACYHFENLSSLTSGAFSNGHALLLPRLKDKSDEYEYDDGSIDSFDVEPDTSPLFRFTHHVRSSGPSFDPVQASRFGFEALSPLPTRLLERRPGSLPEARASFFAVDNGEVLLYTVKPADLGEGVVLRLSELTGQDVTARITSDVFELGNPERVETDEEGGAPLSLEAGAVLVPLGPFETATVRLEATPSWSPVTLLVDKNASPGSIRLSWSEGVSPYTLVRSAAPSGESWETLVDEEPIQQHDDPVLDDGLSWFYLVH